VIGVPACGKPGLAPGLDQYTCDGGLCAAPGVIRGEVVYGGGERGDAILLLFDVAALPPPDGDGSGAVAVARVPQSNLFGSASGAGVFSAPFTFTQVRSGRSYQIRAFIDATHEFDPLFDYAQQPRAGDPVGGHGEIDPAGELRLLPIQVGPGQVVNGVTVGFPRVLSYDPPSFELIGGSQTLDQEMDRPARLKLRIAHLPARGASFANAHFALELDRDAQGKPRSMFKDGLYDVFPRVFLRQLTSVDGSGEAPLAPGSGAIVPCQVVSLPVLPALLDLPAGAPAVAQDLLEVMVEPFALGADLRLLPRIPAGGYQLVVIQRSGQTWTLPNQLGDPANAGTPYFAASQAEAVSIAPLGTLPANSVSGTVVWSGGTSIASGNIVVQAYRDDPYDPPPPLGAALPVRVQIVPASAAVADARGFRAPYRIGGLAPGRYIVHALDDVDGNFSAFALLRTPTGGDLVGAVLEPGSGRPASVEVSGDVTGQDVTLTQQLSSDPPAFEIDPSTPARMPADQVTPVRFVVRARPHSFPAGKAPAPQFAVQLVRDPAGAAVDADQDGLPDVWPRVFLVRLDPSDPSGLTQYRSPDLHTTRTQVIAAAVDPTRFLPALSGGNAPPVFTGHLEIIVRPALFDASTPAARPRRLPSLQPGPYRIVLLSQTGQVWQIPNEAGTAALDPRAVCSSAPCAPGTVQTQSQSGAFQILAPSQAAHTGGIAGSLTVAGAPAIAAAYVFAYAKDAQPPFGLPVSADFHPGSEFQGGTVGYTLPNLPGGDYLVGAVVDTRGDFAMTPALFAMAPGEGSLVAASIASVGTTFASLDLTVAATMPPRPSFQLARSMSGADLDFPFNGSALAAMQIEISAILGANVAALRPDTSAALALACSGSGKPVAGSVSIQLIKVADAAGLVPEVDSSGKATVLSGSLDSSQFSSASCTPGGLYAATGLLAVLVQKASSAKVNLLDPRVPPLPVPLVPGRYSLAITSASKQVWRVPNELQPGLLDPAAMLVTPATTQALLRTQQVAVNVSP
jgi:uncharacterized protein (DUF2141 family)